MYQSTPHSLEHFLLTVTPYAVFFFILGIIAFGIIIAYVIRLWLTQTATFQIQKDVADIRSHLLGLDIESNISNHEQVIDGGYVKPLPIKKKKEYRKPRKLFIWMALSIPVLIICLIVTVNFIS